MLISNFNKTFASSTIERLPLPQRKLRFPVLKMALALNHVVLLTLACLLQFCGLRYPLIIQVWYLQHCLPTHRLCCGLIIARIGEGLAAVERVQHNHGSNCYDRI